MIKANIAKNELDKWSYGVYGKHYKYFKEISKKDVSLNHIVYLDYINHNPWKALSTLKIDFFEIKNESKNFCPFSDREYFAIAPFILLSREPEKYFNNIEELKNSPFKEIALDKSWNLSSYNEDKFGITSIHQSILGSGYTDNIRPGDGSKSIESIIIDLDNGDSIICFVWKWFNK